MRDQNVVWVRPHKSPGATRHSIHRSASCQPPALYPDDPTVFPSEGTCAFMPHTSRAPGRPHRSLLGAAARGTETSTTRSLSAIAERSWVKPAPRTRFRAAALREIGDTYPCVVRRSCPAAAQPYRRGEANADTDHGRRHHHVRHPRAHQDRPKQPNNHSTGKPIQVCGPSVPFSFPDGRQDLVTLTVPPRALPDQTRAPLFSFPLVHPAVKGRRVPDHPLPATINSD